MEVRLNKLISDSGLCSRREADKFIEEGRVTVNGSLPQVGQKVTEADIVMLDDILGFTPLKEGRIVLNGILLDKGNVDVVRKQTAWIPQELALPLEWVKDMVQLPFGLKANRGTPFSETRLFACFEDLGLEQELYYKRVNEISGGQRQRMMIAVASMIGKPLTIVDEPTSALDSGSAEKVLSFFRRQTENGSAILTVSHDKRFANGCDRHIIMK